MIPRYAAGGQYLVCIAPIAFGYGLLVRFAGKSARESTPFREQGSHYPFLGGLEAAFRWRAATI
jgi:hypothetical protein